VCVTGDIVGLHVTLRPDSRLAINVDGLTHPGRGLEWATESVLHREDEHG
jgi:hypothetical protein